MASRFAQISLGLLAVMSPCAFAAPITQNTAPSSSSGGKQGISYNNANTAAAYPYASWSYNWNYTSNGNPGKPFVPMLHDNQPWTLSAWASHTQGAEYCLAFNEPDQSVGAGGSNIDPGTAAAQYKSTYEKGGCANLGAPAVSSQDAPNMGLSWLSSFMSPSNCGSCKIDYVPVHFYGPDSPDTLPAFQAFVTKAHTQTNKPIWVTEFALYQGASDTGNANFISQAAQWMDKQGFVQRYSPIKGGTYTTEMTVGSAVGQAYKGA